MTDEEKEPKKPVPYNQCDPDNGRHFFEKIGKEIAVICQCGKKRRNQLE